MYLLLGDSKASSISTQFREVAWRASQRLRPHDEGKAEIWNFLGVGPYGPELQGLCGDLSIKKVTKIPLH